MNNNIKKLVLKYETLKCELEESEKLAEQYKERFMNEIFPEQYDDLYVDEENMGQECKCSNEEKEDESPIITETVRKIYKKLSLKLHPDRNLNLNEEEKLENEILFKEVLESYESGDLCNLLVRAREYRIKIPELLNEDFQILQKNIDNLQEKITKLTKQTSWIWCTTDDQRVKDRIKKHCNELIKKSILFDWIVEDDDRDCAICLETLIKGNQEKRIICGHIYHRDCIVSWFSIRFSCPLCGRSFE